jgi:hypothetical protein
MARWARNRPAEAASLTTNFEHDYTLPYTLAMSYILRGPFKKLRSGSNTTLCVSKGFKIEDGLRSKSASMKQDLG